jgi:hypothetical protein
MLEVVNFNTDTIRISVGLEKTIIYIEIDHGSCVESYSLSVNRSEGIIIKKIIDGSIVLGVQDENGN